MRKFKYKKMDTTYFCQLCNVMVLFGYLITGMTTTNDIFASVGDDVMFSSMLLPLPSLTDIVTVFNKNNGLLFAARGVLYKTSDPYNGRIIFNGNTTTGELNFTLKSISRTDSGTYKYVYGSASYVGQTLYVFGIPSQPVIEEISQPIQNTNLVLNCTVESQTIPLNHNLTMLHKWNINGSYISTSSSRFNMTGSILSVQNIQRNDKGVQIKCQAIESGGLTSDYSSLYTVDPEYGPTTVNFVPAKRFYSITEEGTFPDITCSADCKPNCTYAWTKNDQLTSNLSGSILSLRNIYRNDTGLYRCRAWNKYGIRNTGDITVDVLYGPGKVTFTPEKTNYSITESGTIPVIISSADCNPICNYTWTKNEQDTFHGDGSVLSLRNTYCYDTGIYRCAAWNDHGKKNSNYINVDGLCKPRTSQNPLKTEYAISDGSSLNITVQYIAYPNPTFHWFKNLSNGSSKQITDDQNDVHIVNSAINKYTFVTEFIRRNLKEIDFGKYILVARNRIGTSEDVFTVKKIGIPYKPFGGLATCTGYNSAVISWVSGFNNGDDQRFSIVYQAVGETEQTVVSGIKDPGKHKLIRHSIVHLRESQTYIFEIYSENSLGKSSRIEVNCSTTANPNTNSYLNTGVVVGAVLGSIILLILIVVTIIVVVLFRRFQTASGKGKNELEINGSNKREDDKENETNIYNEVIPEDGDYASENTYRNHLKYETLQQTKIQPKYEQIKLEDRPKVDDLNEYENTDLH